jgi:hypothetical protein
MSSENEQLYVDLLTKSLATDTPPQYADLITSTRSNPQQAKEMNWGVARQARVEGLDEIAIAQLFASSPYASVFKEEAISQVSDHIRNITSWAYQDRMDSFTPLDLSPQRTYMDLAEIDSAQHGMLKEVATVDPERAKRVDRSFADAAYSADLPPEDFRAALEAGPYTQSLVANNASPLKINSYLNFHEVSYRNREIGGIQQTLASKASDIANTGYRALLVAEKSLFAITPLPMNAFKSGLQNVAFPMAATFALSRLPGASDLVTSAVHLGGSLSSSVTHAIAGSALAQFTSAASSMLPEGVNKAFSLQLPLVGQSMGGLISTASNAVVLGSSDVIGKAIGEGGVALAIGNALIQGASAIATKGFSVTLAELSTKAAELTNKTQWVADKWSDLYTSITKKGLNMETNGRAPEQLNAAQQQFMDLIKNHPQAGKLSYSELGKTYAGDPGQAKFDQNDYVAEAAFAQGKSPSEIREIVAASPHLKAAVESGENSQAEIDSYVSRIESQYTEIQASQNQPPKGQNETASLDPEEQYVVELNSTPVDTKANKESESLIKPIIPAEKDKASTEYGFSLQQMLEQRGIQTDRMIINFDGQQKFKMEKGMESPLTNGLSAKDVELLKQAMSDPDFKGSIKISKGGEVLFQRIGEGPPIIDGRQLYKPAIKLEYQSPSQLLHEQSSKGVESQGLRQVNDIALNAFRAGASTDEVKAALLHGETAKALDEPSLNALVSAAKGAIALERNASAPEKTAEKVPAMAK